MLIILLKKKKPHNNNNNEMKEYLNIRLSNYDPTDDFTQTYNPNLTSMLKFPISCCHYLKCLFFFVILKTQKIVAE